MTDEDLATTPLTEMHRGLGARMVPFAGYLMPVQFEGVMAEHAWTRGQAGLFDVSHMGQIVARPCDGGGWASLAPALEAAMPVDLVDLPEGRQRYGLLTNDAGGIEDDLMVANRGDHGFLVVNAANKAADLERLRGLCPDVEFEMIGDRALVALQGPAAEAVLAEHAPDCAAMRFMDVAVTRIGGAGAWVSRSGYTGEDGFEISLPAGDAPGIVEALLADDRVRPIGLGARDSLRLEAGLCLHGHDIGPDTTPVEAALTWAVGKVRRTGGARAGGFPGADTILRQIAGGAPRKRVGLRPEGRAPMREGTALFDGDTPVGAVTSGGFGPTVGAPVAMGYVAADRAQTGTALTGEVRGKRLPVAVAPLPFTQANFKR